MKGKYSNEAKEVINNVVTKFPRVILAADIEDGINGPDDFKLCIEIANRYNNYDSLLEALKNCVVVMERARNILSGKDGGNWGMLDTTQAKEVIQKCEQ